MCLIVKKDVNFEVAKEDIVVYKMLLPVQSYFGADAGWQTPFQKVYIGRIKEGKELKAEGYAIKKPYNEDLDMVERGVVHVFENEKDCIKESIWSFCSKVFECVIPKGTEFIEGVYGVDAVKSYGAKEIKFVKPIN